MTDPIICPALAPNSAPGAEPTTHPDFNNPKDIVLRSADNVRFNITRRDLERTSGWFRDMFGAAHRTSVAEASEEIPVFEEAATLEPLLKLALGLSLRPGSLASVEACEPVLVAARKYDMDGVAQTVILYLRVALLELKDPVLQYIIACRYDMPTLREAAYQQCVRVEIDFTRLRGLEGDHIAKLIVARTQHTEDIHFVLSETEDAIAPCYYMNNGLCNCCRGTLSASVRPIWEKFVKASMRRSLRIPSIEKVLFDPDVHPLYEALIETPCAHGRRPFEKIKEQLSAALKQREGQRASQL